MRVAGSAQDQVGGAEDLGAFEDLHEVGAGVEAQGRVAVCAVVENAGVQAFGPSPSSFSIFAATAPGGRGPKEPGAPSPRPPGSAVGRSSGALWGPR